MRVVLVLPCYAKATMRTRGGGARGASLGASTSPTPNTTKHPMLPSPRRMATPEMGVAVASVTPGPAAAAAPTPTTTTHGMAKQALERLKADLHALTSWGPVGEAREVLAAIDQAWTADPGCLE